MPIKLNIPIISITHEKDDNENVVNNYNIAETVTDVEELEVENRLKNKSKKKKRNNTNKCNKLAYDSTAYTDVEDIEASDDEIIDKRIVKHYVPIKLDDFDLDPSTCEEIHNVQPQNVRAKNKKIHSQKSITKLYKSKNDLFVKESDYSVLTDTEDINASDNEEYTAPDCHLPNDMFDFVDHVNIQDSNDVESDLAMKTFIHSDDDFTKPKSNKNKFLCTPKVASNLLTDVETVSDSDKSVKCNAPKKVRKRKTKHNMKYKGSVTDIEDLDLSKEEAIKSNVYKNKSQTLHLTPKVKKILQSQSVAYDSDDEEIFIKPKRHIKKNECNLFPVQIDDGLTDVDDLNISDHDDYVYSSDEMDKKVAEFSEYCKDTKLTHKVNEMEYQHVDSDNAEFLNPLLYHYDDVHTDVETLNSFEVDTSVKRRAKNENDTESETFSDDEYYRFNERNINLPKPYRKLVEIAERKSGKPSIIISPLDEKCDYQPGVINDCPTDFECLSDDDSELNDYENTMRCPSPSLPQTENSTVHSFDMLQKGQPNLKLHKEVLTDNEFIDVKKEKFKTFIPKKNSQPSKFLNVNTECVACHTDVEDLSDNDEPSNKMVLNIPGADNALLTDVDDIELSDNEGVDYNITGCPSDVTHEIGGEVIITAEGNNLTKNLNFVKDSLYRYQYSPLVTDTEDVAASADETESNQYHAFVPTNIDKQLNDVSISNVYSRCKNKINIDNPSELLYLKGGHITDNHTDVEEFESDDVSDNAIEATENFSVDSNKVSINWKSGSVLFGLVKEGEWDATKKGPQREPTPQATLEAVENQDSDATINEEITYESVLLSNLNRNSPDSPIPNYRAASYTEIDAMLDRMLTEVEYQEKLFSLDLDIIETNRCINTLELIPSNDALIEVPIQKSTQIPKQYESTEAIFVENFNNYEMICFQNDNQNIIVENEYDLISFDEDKNDQDANLNLLDVASGSNVNTVEELDITTGFHPSLVKRLHHASSESLSEVSDTLQDSWDDESDNDVQNYEPIEAICFKTFNNDIWWEGTYRNLSIVPEEDEENISLIGTTYSSNEGNQLMTAKQTYDRQLSNSSSSSDYDNENIVKAEVKLLVKTSDEGTDEIEIHSVREFMEPNTPKIKSNNNLPEVNTCLVDFSTKNSKPVYTLQRLFVRTPKSDKECSSVASTKPEFVATTKENFPLTLENENKPDLFANTPFYPCYESLPKTIPKNPQSTIEFIHYSDQSSLPQAYCDWIPIVDSGRGKSTTIAHEAKLDINDKELIDINSASIKETNASVNVEIKPSTVDINKAKDDKKHKKGFFGTLKTMVSKSIDYSDSESEKSQKKDKKEKKKKKKDKLTKESDNAEVKSPETKVEQTDIETNKPKDQTSPINDIKPEKENVLENDIIKSDDDKREPIVEISKKFETKVYETNDFQVEVKPVVPVKEKVIYDVDVNATIEKIEQEILKTGEEPLPSIPADQVLLDMSIPDESSNDIKMSTHNLIQNEINFQGWSDDKYNVNQPTPVAPESQKAKRKHGRLFGFLTKKSSKEVDDSDDEKGDQSSKQEIIEKQDKEESKEQVTDKAEDRKSGFFNVFVKKNKKEDEEKDKEKDKVDVKNETNEDLPPKIIIHVPTLADIRLTKDFLRDEVEHYDDVRPIIPQAADEAPANIEADKTENRKSGIFSGLFSKKDKKEEVEKVDGQEETKPKVKTPIFGKKDKKDDKDDKDEKVEKIEVVEEVKPKAKTPIFGKKEKKDDKDEKVEKIEVVEEVKPKAKTPIFGKKEKKDDIDEKVEIVEEAKQKTKIPIFGKKEKKDDKEEKIEVVEEVKQKTKTPIFGKKDKKGDKDKDDKTEVVEDAKPKTWTPIFGKKEKAVKPVMSEMVIKDIKDTSNFLQSEIDLYEDVRPDIAKYKSTEQKNDEKPEADSAPEVKIKEVTSPKKSIFKIFSKKESTIESDDIAEKTTREVEKVEVSTEVSEPTTDGGVTSPKKGLFKGLFNKKDKKEPESDTKPTEEIQIETQFKPEEISNFIKTEIDNYEDVKTFKPEDIKLKLEKLNEVVNGHDTVEIVEEALMKADSKTVKAAAAKLNDTNEIQLRDETKSFLDSEIKNYEDVKPKKISIVEELESVNEKIKSKSSKTKKLKKKLKRDSSESGEESDTSSSISKFKIFKSHKKDKTKIVRPVLSEEVQESMNNTDNFLQKEKENYEDARNEKDEKDVKDEIKSEVKPVSTSKPKKYKKDSSESGEESDGGTKRSKFSIFGKKSSTQKPIEEFPSKEDILLSETVKDMKDTSDFIKSEVDNYHDVKPVIKENDTDLSQKMKKESSESGEESDSSLRKSKFKLFSKKSKKSELKDIPSAECILDDDIEIKTNEVEIKSPELAVKSEQKEKKGLFGIFSKKSTKQESKDETTTDMKLTDEFLKQEVEKYEDSQVCHKDDTQKEKETEKSDAQKEQEEQKEQKENRKSGLFTGIFGKKDKPATEIQVDKDSKIETATNVKLTDEFLIQEVEKHEASQVSHTDDAQKGQEKTKSDTQKEPEEQKENRKSGLFTGIFGKKDKPATETPVDKNNKIETATDIKLTDDFIKHEVEKYEDSQVCHKDDTQKEQEEEKSDALKEQEEQKENRKSGLFTGIFGKKDKPATEVQVDKDSKVETTADIKLTDDLIKQEVDKYEDSQVSYKDDTQKEEVKRKVDTQKEPAEQKENRKSGLFTGIFGKKDKSATETPVDKDSKAETAADIKLTDDFIKQEVDKDEDSQVIHKDDTQKEQGKGKGEAPKEPEEEKENRKSGLFTGIFGKKDKSATETPVDKDSKSEIAADLKLTDDFIKQEVDKYEDSQVIHKDDTQKEQGKGKDDAPKEPEEQKENRKSGLFTGIFGKKDKPATEIPVDKDSKVETAADIKLTDDFIKQEVDKYEDSQVSHKDDTRKEQAKGKGDSQKEPEAQKENRKSGLFTGIFGKKDKPAPETQVEKEIDIIADINDALKIADDKDETTKTQKEVKFENVATLIETSKVETVTQLNNLSEATEQVRLVTTTVYKSPEEIVKVAEEKESSVTPETATETSKPTKLDDEKKKTKDKSKDKDKKSKKGFLGKLFGSTSEKDSIDVDTEVATSNVSIEKEIEIEAKSKPKSKGFLSKLSDKISTSAAEVKDAIKVTEQEVKKEIDKDITAAKQSAAEAKQSMEEKGEQLKDKTAKRVEDLKDKSEALKTTIQDTIESSETKLKEEVNKAQEEALKAKQTADEKVQEVKTQSTKLVDEKLTELKELTTQTQHFVEESVENAAIETSEKIKVIESKKESLVSEGKETIKKIESNLSDEIKILEHKVSETNELITKTIEKSTDEAKQTLTTQASSVKETVTETKMDIESNIQADLRDIKQEIQQVKETTVESTKEVLDSVKEKSEQLKQDLKQSESKVEQKLKDVQQNIVETKESVIEKTQEMRTDTASKVKQVTDAAKETTDIIKTDIKSTEHKLEEKLNDVQQKISDSQASVTKKTKEVKELKDKKIKEATTAVKETSEKVKKEIKSSESKLEQKVQKGSSETQKQVKDVKDKSVKHLTNLAKETKKSAIEKTQEVKDMKDEKIKQVKSTSKETSKKLKEEVKVSESKIEKKLKDVQQTVSHTQKSVAEKTQKVKDLKDDRFKQAKSAVKDTQKSVVETAQKVNNQKDEKVKQVKTTVKDTQKSVAEKTQKVKDLKDEKIEQVKTVVKDTQKSLTDKTQEIKDSKNEKINVVATAVQQTSKKQESKVEQKLKDVKQTISETQQSVSEKAQEIKELKDEKIKKVEETVKETSEKLKEEIKASETKLEQKLQDVKETFSEKQKSVIEKSQQVKDETLKQTTDVVKGVESKITEKVADLQQTVSEAKQTTTEKLQGLKQDAVKDVQAIKSEAKTLDDDITTLKESVKTEIAETKTQLKDKMKDLKETTTEKVSELQSKGQTKIEETSTALHKTVKESTESIKDNVKGTFESVSTKVASTAESTKAKLVDEAKDIKQEVTKSKETVTQELQKIKDVKEDILTKSRDVIVTGKESIQQVKEGALSTAETIKSDVKDTIKTSESKIKEEVKVIQQDIASTKQAIVKQTQEIKDSAVDEVTKLQSDAQSKLKEVDDSIKAVEKESEAKIKESVQKAEETLSTKAKDVTERAEKTINQKLDNLQQDITKTKESAADKLQEIKELKDDKVKEISNLKDEAQSNVTQAAASLSNNVISTKETLQQDVLDAKQASEAKLKQLKDEKLKDIGDLKTKIDTAVADAKDSAGKGLEKVKDAEKTAKDALKGVEDNIKSEVKDVQQTISETKQSAEEKVKETIEDTKQALTTELDKAKTTIQDEVKDAQQAMLKTQEDVDGKLQDTKEAFKHIKDEKAKEISELKDKAESKIQDINQSALESTEKIKESISSAKDSVVADAKSIIKGTEKGIDSAEESVKSRKGSKGILGKIGGKLTKSLSKDKDEPTEESDKDKKGKQKGFFGKIGERFGSKTELESMASESIKKDAKDEKKADESESKTEPSEKEHKSKKGIFGKLSDKLHSKKSDGDKSDITTDSTEKITEIVVDTVETAEDQNDETLYPRRKPLFSLDSEEDTSEFNTAKRDSVKSNILENFSEQALEALVSDLKIEKEEMIKDEEPESNHLIEAEEINVDPDKKEIKLKRVERKFERMASEVIEKDLAEAKQSDVSTPEFEEKRETEYQKVVSQLSREEVSEYQKEYTTLWDEQTFSHTDEWDSKTPESQADLIELPPGEIVYMAPVTLNKDSLINKAGIEVEVIPRMPSPYASPKPKRKKHKKRAKSEMGFHSKCNLEEDRGSLPDLYNCKKGSVYEYVMRQGPQRFLSRSVEDPKIALNLYNSKDEVDISKSLGSSDSLSKGHIMDAVINWLNKSGSLECVNQSGASLTDTNISICDDNESLELSCYSEKNNSRSDNVIPDIFISEDEALIVYKEYKTVYQHRDDICQSIETNSVPLTQTSKEITDFPLPKPRTKTSDKQLDLISPVEQYNLDETQISPIRDDNLGIENVQVGISPSESIIESYSERKKFWENVSREASQESVKRQNTQDGSSKQPSATSSARTSVHEIASSPPVPKPRNIAQTSLDNLTKDEDNEPIVSEYKSSFTDPSTKVIPNVETIQEPQQKLESTDSIDSDNETSGPINVSSGYENTGYISDGGDVENYISDSEIEDRVPQIRERQMSMCQAPSTARRTIYERSCSLPTEDLYEVSAQSILLRKQYFESQIKKDMVEDELMTEIQEEEPLPEYKTLNKPIGEAEPHEMKSVPDNINFDIKPRSAAAEKKAEALILDDDYDFKVESYSMHGNIPEEAEDTEVSAQDIFLTRSKSNIVEMHVDKSEIEDSEKKSDTTETIKLSPSKADEPDDIPEIKISSAKQISVDDSKSTMKRSHEIAELASPVNQPEQHVHEVVWEAPIQSHTFDERVYDIESEHQIFVEKDEELSGSVRDESDLGSEIHQDHSESIGSDRKSESQADIEKLILESLHHQNISPEEAKVIAQELVADIEAEIHRRHSVDYVEPPAPEFAKTQVSEYLKHLAEVKGLDSREVELVQSVLARKQREISKLSRGDTQASSMEITDEDLKYSGADCSPSGSRMHILEEQIDQLEAEKTYDQQFGQEFSTEMTHEHREQQSHTTKEYGVLHEDQPISIKSDTKMLASENVTSEKSITGIKDIIAEEDETSLKSASIEEAKEVIKSDLNIEQRQVAQGKDFFEDNKSTATVSDVVYQDTNKVENTRTTYKDDQISTESNLLAQADELQHIKGIYTSVDNKKSISDNKLEDVSSIATRSVEGTTQSHKKEDVTFETKSDMEQEVTKVSSKVVESTTNTIIDHSHQEVTTSTVTTAELKEDELIELLESEEECKITRNTSEESKSDDIKSPDEYFSASSGKKSEPEDMNKIVFRKLQRRKDDTSSSSSNLKNDRKSGIDFEAYSSSGESHYQSFEIESSRSRPCSSDVEVMVAAGSSEYESALTSQDISGPNLTSTEYHTAVSSLSSKESMKSLDSESSGNLGSVEVSEASETLVPSEFELGPEDQEDEYQQHLLRQNTDASETEILLENEKSFDNSEEDIDIVGSENTIPRMKRSQEMTFQPEPKSLVPESPQFEAGVEGEEKLGTSLDDGSVLSVSLSSTSSLAAQRTVIELSRAESDRLGGGMSMSNLSEQLSLDDPEFIGSRENLSTTPIPSTTEMSTSTPFYADDLKIDNVTLTTSSVDENGVQSVSTQVISQSHTPEAEKNIIDDFNQKHPEPEPKKRGHRRNESTSFIPKLISVHPASPKIQQEKYTFDLTCKEEYSHEKKDIDERDESYNTEADQGIQRDMYEGKYETESEIDFDVKENDLSRPQSQVSKTDSDRDRIPSSALTDSELMDLAKCSSEAVSDPIERPTSPELTDENILKNDTADFSAHTPIIDELDEDKEFENDVDWKNFNKIPIEKILDKRDSHGKVSSTSSEKSSLDEAEAEAAFSMVAHTSPAHTVKQICPIMEDEDAEKSELEAREKLKKDMERRQIQLREQQPSGAIPDIKVTEHMTPMDRKDFQYPELEIVEKQEEKQEETQMSTPQTPASNSSKSSESTDQGREYVIDESEMSIPEESESQMLDEKTTESKSEVATVLEKTITCETDKETASPTESPNSDSFELLEKPDLMDEFVVIEEVAKEAHEGDMEGKSLKIAHHKMTKKHDEEVEDYLVKSAPSPSTKMTEIKYYPDGSSSDELGFEFEDSPPTANQKAAPKTTKDYVYEYDRELEANKKWIEQQFQGDHAAMLAAGYGYEMEFERCPLEDIKEEDITDFDSSRIGSLNSQKESGGSLGSVKDSYSSTPEYDVLAGRKYFTKSGEHDDVSMSSLQEFENLERAMSLENRKFLAGSQDSSSNGSFKTRYFGRSGQGDDISVNSLKEFEGLEKACIAAHKVEIKAKEEELLLAQIDEGQESLGSESESCETITGTDKKIAESDEEDYEKRMFEIDEIIRQAQSNVERFIDLKEGEKTESIGRGDSVEEVSKIPDLDLDTPLTTKVTKVQWNDPEDTMLVSTDSLDLKEKPSRHGSTDSLEQSKTGADIMTASTDSIEFQTQKSKTMTTDSLNKDKNQKMTLSDSLELGNISSTQGGYSDSIDDDGSRIGVYDQSSSSTGKDVSLSGKDEQADFNKQHPDMMLESTDSIASTSTATHATYQYESDSVFSGSFTSGGSNTMVSSTDGIDHTLQTQVDLSDAVRKVWFGEEDDSRPYVTEVIEPGETEITRYTFKGPLADDQLKHFMEDFKEGEEVQEEETVDKFGNVHVKRVVTKKILIRDEEGESVSEGMIKRTYMDEKGTKTIYTQQFERTDNTNEAVRSLLSSIAGDASGEASSSWERPSEPQTHYKAKASRRRPLPIEISLDDKTMIEVDPREHDWRFNLPDHAEKDESQPESGEQTSTDTRQVADQHKLSDEMKELLRDLEKEAKK